MRDLRIIELAQDTEVLVQPPTLLMPSPALPVKKPGPTTYRMVVENGAGERREITLQASQFVRLVEHVDTAGDHHLSERDKGRAGALDLMLTWIKHYKGDPASFKSWIHDCVVMQGEVWASEERP